MADSASLDLPQSILTKNEFSNPYILSTKAKNTDMVEKEQQKQNTEENDESPPKADSEEVDANNFDFLAKVEDPGLNKSQTENGSRGFGKRKASQSSQYSKGSGGSRKNANQTAAAVVINSMGSKNPEFQSLKNLKSVLATR